MLNDALDTLLKQFRVSASVFQQGSFCGHSSFEGATPAQEDSVPDRAEALEEQSSQAGAEKRPSTGHIHLVLQGSLAIYHQESEVAMLKGPALVVYPRGRSHRIAAEENALLICADITFEGGIAHPLMSRLPEFMVAQQEDLPEASAVLNALLVETQQTSTLAFKACTDRLIEIILIYLIRKHAQQSKEARGLIAALQDARLARVLEQIFADPGHHWSVEKLAKIAFMSRSAFADVFKSALEQSPMDFVRAYRLQIVITRLQQGYSQAHLASELGYSDTAALSKAFKKVHGLSPQAYLSKIKVV